MSKLRFAVPTVVAVVVAGLAISTALGHGKPRTTEKTWTTVFKSPISIEGLTLDDEGNLYVPQRGGAAGCSIVRLDAEGGADQAGVTVARMNPPCNPAGLAFGPDGRLYLTGFGAAGDEIGVVRPNDADPANPPVASGFATGTPGANGVAFDDDGNLYVSDGGTAQGRVFRVGPSGGAATVLFRVPPMANAAGVGRQNQTLQPPVAAAPPATQGIVANGLAFDKHGDLFVADTARGALWRVELSRRGELRTPTGCDVTYTADTLCLDALFVQHPALDGADGIALDREGTIWVDPNERNAIVTVDRGGDVDEFFRNPVDAANLRNGGPLEFPTSPVLAGRRFCTTSSDGNRRDNSPNTAGEARPASAVIGKVSCLDQRLKVSGLPLPVD
jgi:sugar lactone lactonase YvrE